MATNNSSNQEYINNADGWALSGGTAKRKLTIQTGDVTITGGTRTLTLGGNLTTAGTLTTGGVLTTAGTLTTGGNFTTSGASALTLTTTGITTVTLPTAGTLATVAGTETYTNKRITKRVGTTTSTATPSIATDTYDMYTITALAVNITSVTVTGTPTNGQTLWIAITGTAARTIAWGSSFEASTVSLPTTTITTARLDVGFIWNTVTSKWRVIAVA